MIIVAAAAELGPLADLTITPGCGVVLVVVGGTLEVSNISYDYMMCAGEKEDRATAYGVRTLWPGLVWSGLVWSGLEGACRALRFLSTGVTG